MKRFLAFIALVLVSAGVAVAQCGNISAANISISPATYTAEDVITVTIDASGTCLAGQGALEMWIFSSAGDAPTNQNFCGSPNTEPAATSLGMNRWSFTFRMTDVIGAPAGQISSFGLIFKTSSPCGTGPGGNNLQTQDISLVPQPLAYTERVARLFPRLVTDEDVVTLYVNHSLASNPNIQIDDSLYIYAFSDVIPAGGGSPGFRQVTDWGNVGSTDNLKLRFGGDNNQFLTFIPRRLFNLAPGEKMTNFKIVIRNKGGTQQISDQVFPLTVLP